MGKESLQPDEVVAILKKELADFEKNNQLEIVGTVLEVSGGVALVYGLTSAKVGEQVTFEHGQKGLVLNLAANYVGVAILDNPTLIKEGDHVQATGEVSMIPVSENLLGRVIDPLGQPIDGKGPIKGPFVAMQMERKAPGVIYREPVSEALQTGVKKIDIMIPIGLGQRQLIVGDRQTGKTTLAIDTILNQRERFEAGDPVYCIYVAIGQKASSVAQVVATLEAHGAMEYTIVVLASAALPASLQFLAPFASMAIGEYFRDTGHHALVVFDDLAKHAVSYRELSLLLKRPPGREAYPGDIFYLHSRLLERAAKINRNDKIAAQMNDLPKALKQKVRGGGSLTALPIVEIQEGDLSAYIPTNIISITDGQILLEGKLFNAGIRPAVNIGLSVSRVGGNAQLPAMRQVAGPLKIDQSQADELASFAKLGSELDVATQRIIDRGLKNRALLNQPAYHPVPVAEQILIAYASVHGFLDAVPLAQVDNFVTSYIEAIMDNYPKLFKKITQGKMKASTMTILDKVARELLHQ